MPQQVFIKVVGFSDAERHALNTVFRLSEGRPTQYCLWEPGAPVTPQLAFLDGLSAEARVEAESRQPTGLKLAWFGDEPPHGMWCVFPQPVSWPDVVAALDDVYAAPADLEFDIDLSGNDEPETLPPEDVPPDPGGLRRALIANPDLNERLYLRAKLALNHLTIADEAETAAQALELMRGQKYLLALVDMGLPGSDGWGFIRKLKDGNPIPHVIVTKSGASMAERLRARFAGADACLPNPPDPERLQELLRKVH
jgi:CheY-like chemotaxis protein